MHEAVAFTSSRETPFYGWFLGFLVMVVDKPDDVFSVLTGKSCMEKAPVYKFFNRGVALFTAPGKRLTFSGKNEMLQRNCPPTAHIWRPQRKILNTAFNLKILQSFIPIFNGKVKCLVRNMDKMVGQEAFDVSHIMHACTLDMVCCEYFVVRVKRIY